MANTFFDNILKSGLSKAIDSELGNPAPPAPQNTNPKSDTQIQTTPTGKGTVTKVAGTLPLFGDVPKATLIGGAMVALVGGIVLWKTLK